jgi:hypothetical protein
MSDANELLDGLTDEDISAYTATPAEEEHIVIDLDRIITVPSALRRIAVEHDHNVETVTFDCPRYWDGIDMSTMTIYINYELSNEYCDAYPVEGVTVDAEDESIMHFDWTISRNVTQVEGKIKFSICIKELDEKGLEVTHWNSEICDQMYVSEGMECDQGEILDSNPDVVMILTRKVDEFSEDVEGFSKDVDGFSKELAVAVDVTNKTEEALDEIIEMQEALIGGYHSDDVIKRTIVIRDEEESLRDIFANFSYGDPIGTLPAYGTNSIVDYIAKVGYTVISVIDMYNSVYNFYLAHNTDDEFLYFTCSMDDCIYTISCCDNEFDADSDRLILKYEGFAERDNYVDSVMSDTSKQTVQNKVIKKYVDDSVAQSDSELRFFVQDVDEGIRTDVVNLVQNSEASIRANMPEKTTWDYRREVNIGGSDAGVPDKYLIGRFPVGDSQISIEFKTTTGSSTYYGMLIISAAGSTEGRYAVAKMYGDVDNVLTQWISFYNEVAEINSVYVFVAFPWYSKNLLHIQCANLTGDPIGLMTVPKNGIPSGLPRPTNAFAEAFNKLMSGATGVNEEV